MQVDSKSVGKQGLYRGLKVSIQSYRDFNIESIYLWLR
jgi:hypothetical protein